MISVVIPSYNYARFLPQAVASVAFQTYQDIELVIVDDASSDGSAEVIRALAEEHAARFSNIVTILRTENKGAHYTINEGIAASRGELVTILNADDLVEPERFSVMTEAMGAARLAFSAVRCIDVQGNTAETEQARQFEAVQRHIEGKRFMALSALGENVAISTGNMLFERALFEQLGGFRNYKYVHDYDFFLRACLVTEPVFAADTAYLYRLHGENSFTKLAAEGLRENRMVWLDIYGRVKRREVQNPIMLADDYKAEFAAAVAAAGAKKKALWTLAGTPLARAGVGYLKRKYNV